LRVFSVSVGTNFCHEKTSLCVSIQWRFRHPFW